MPRKSEPSESREMHVLADLGKALRMARIDRDLQQAEVAERARITQPMLSAIERGARNPTVETLDAVLVALGLDLVGLSKYLGGHKDEPIQLDFGDMVSILLRHAVREGHVSESDLLQMLSGTQEATDEPEEDPS